MSRNTTRQPAARPAPSPRLPRSHLPAESEENYPGVNRTALVDFILPTIALIDHDGFIRRSIVLARCEWIDQLDGIPSSANQCADRPRRAPNRLLFRCFRRCPLV